MQMTRKEIYDAIWTRTVQGLAEEYQLNYPILLQRIKEEDIPRPSRREIIYIRQGEEGLRAVHRPELTGDPDKQVKLSVKRNAKQPVKREPVESPKEELVEAAEPQKAEDFPEPEEPVPQEAPGLIDYENHPRWSGLYFLKTPERRRVIRECEAIRVDRNELLHPKVLEYQKEIEAYQTQREILGYENISGTVLGHPPFVERVSEENIGRVLTILDSLYRALERLGETVLEDGSVAIHDQIVSLKFTESRTRENVDPSVYEELKEGEGKKWVMRYTGKLTLSVGYLYSVRDRKKDRIEDRLGDVLELLYLTAFQLSQNRDPNDETAAQSSFSLELERTEDLIQQAKDYEDAERIRTLLKAVQKKLGSGELEYQDYWPTWAAWASEKAEWLDPTVGHRDEILGRRHDPILQPPKLNA